MNITEMMTESKILHSNNLFKWIALFSTQKDTIVITPLTPIEELFNLKNQSVLNLALNDFQQNYITNIINENALSELVQQFNTSLNLKIVDYDLALDKIAKILLIINKDCKLTPSALKIFLDLLDKYSTKQLNIIICGFENARELSEQPFKMINLHILTSDLRHMISWHTLEKLVLLDTSEPTEIIDRDKFKAFLELKTRTVLTIKDIEDYFNGHISMNSFLIHQALAEL